MRSSLVKMVSATQRRLYNETVRHDKVHPNYLKLKTEQARIQSLGDDNVSMIDLPKTIMTFYFI